MVYRSYKNMIDIIKIFNLMKDTLNDINSHRPTTLNEIHKTSNVTPFNILITTVLSARSRDQNTSRVAKKLFAKYKTPKTLSNADILKIEETIKSIGFYHVKSKRIKKIAYIIYKQYNGKVPEELKELIKLPGVGRKTANCVLVYAFNKPAIPVDVHVHRISNRLGLIQTKNVEETELELMKKIHKIYWTKVNEIFVRYGQNVCLPISPLCKLCRLNYCCRYNNIHHERFVNINNNATTQPIEPTR